MHTNNAVLWSNSIPFHTRGPITDAVRQITPKPNSTLFLYTDEIIEAPAVDGKQPDIGGLKQMLGELNDTIPQQRVFAVTH